MFTLTWRTFCALLFLFSLRAVPTNHGSVRGHSARTCQPIATGEASFYGIGDKLDGRRTANGETYSIQKMTAAHRRLPIGTVVRVSRGSKQVFVRINDRGPARWTGRIIDLSPKAFARLGHLKAGVLDVRLAVCN